MDHARASAFSPLLCGTPSQMVADHRHRNIVPGTFIEFNDGFDVLLGHNGTGRTTLLGLLEMLWTRGFGRIADEEFHLECE